MSRAAPARYRARLRRLHWLTAALIVAACTMIHLRKAFERGSDARTLVVEMHFMLGLAILALALPRLLARRANPPPPITPPPHRSAAMTAQVFHIALYAWMIVQPLLGLLSRLTGGRPVGIPFTDLAIPALPHKYEALARLFWQAHVWLGLTFYWVIGLHVLAALWHWAVRRDDTLQRML